MNLPLPKPHRKVHVDLYLDDIDVLRRRYGNGWTARVRDLVATDVQLYKERQDARQRLNLRPPSDE